MGDFPTKVIVGQAKNEFIRPGLVSLTQIFQLKNLRLRSDEDLANDLNRHFKNFYPPNLVRVKPRQNKLSLIFVGV